MSPSARSNSDASLPEYTTAAVRPAVTSPDVEVELVRQRARGQPGRAEGEGAGRVADVGHVDVAGARRLPGAMPLAARIAAPASGEQMSGPVALPTAARAAPWSPPMQAAKAMPRAASAMARRERGGGHQKSTSVSVSV